MSYSASTTAGSGERIAAVGDLELCYETFGDGSDPALVLIMGLATQMIGWRDGFCESLAARGFFVVRFDNRDVGRSTRLDDLPVPTFWQLARRDKARGELHLRGHGARHGRSSRSSRDRPSPRGRCVDGGDDRPDGRGQASRPRPLARLDHGQYRCALVRAASVAHGEGADERSAGGSRGLCGSHDEGVGDHRLTWVRAR